LKLTQCCFNLLMAEQERAVGLTHEDPNEYPADILAEAQALMNSRPGKEPAT